MEVTALILVLTVLVVTFLLIEMNQDRRDRERS